MSDPVTIPRDVYETLEDIRQSGETNMLDVSAVQALADARGDHRTVVWLEENQSKYVEAVFNGVSPEDM